MTPTETVLCIVTLAVICGLLMLMCALTDSLYLLQHTKSVYAPITDGEGDPTNLPSSSDCLNPSARDRL